MPGVGLVPAHMFLLFMVPCYLGTSQKHHRKYIGDPRWCFCLVLWLITYKTRSFNGKVAIAAVFPHADPRRPTPTRTKKLGSRHSVQRQNHIKRSKGGLKKIRTLVDSMTTKIAVTRAEKQRIRAVWAPSVGN